MSVDRAMEINMECVMYSNSMKSDGIFYLHI
jgi:hypothetical protein